MIAPRGLFVFPLEAAMDLELLRAFAMSFGAVAGGGALLVIVPKTFAIGKKWGVVETTVAETSVVASETRDAVRLLADNVNGRLGKIDFILSGVDGENGLRGDMKVVKAKVETLEQERRK